MSGRVRLVIGAMLLLLAVSGSAPQALPPERGVGRRVPNFTLRNTSGEEFSLYSLRGKKAAVITFLGVDCPLGNLYAPRLAELSREYAAKGVAFLAINANARETAADAAAQARTHGIEFPVLKDPGNTVADLLLAERTCETLVLDGRAVLRYRGAIDDQYGQGTRKPAAAHAYLREALDAILAGRPVAVPATPVAGCLLDRVEPPRPALGNAPRVRPAPAEIAEMLDEQEDAEPPAGGSVTYAEHVAPIVQARCQECHRPGQSGPFPLLGYDDARRHAAMIREVVESRRMPPWHADPRHGHFLNDRRLTPVERATLLAWVDRGAPLGDPAKLPAPRRFPDGWTIGTPDIVLEMPEPYAVAAQGTLDYVYFRVPTGFKEDVWVQAAEARPGDPAVVHHIIVYMDDHGKDDGDRRLSRHLCGFAPGDLPSVYPPGTAKKIPAGSDLVFQLHYTPDGTRRVDRSRVGLIVAKEPARHRAYTLGIAQHKFLIPPGAGNHPVHASHTFERDARLLSFMPHMHLRGKSFQYRATYPDGSSEILLSVPAYDFGWQSSYILAEPKPLPKGTRIDCLAHFDNSAANPNNPDPARAVTWGDQTFQEMMIGYMDIVVDR